MTNILKGQANLSAHSGDFNQVAFQIQQALMRMQTAIPVEVTAQRGGGLDIVGFVDVKIAIHQVAGDGDIIPHGELKNLPYCRIQGGTNAIIIDPQPGDLGLAVFSSRDASIFKSSRKVSPPGSHRSYDFSDGFFFGGFRNEAPVQYIEFNQSGIKIYSPTKIECDAPNVVVTAQTASIIASGSASVSAPSISLGAIGQSLHSLVDDRLIDLFNGHTHPDPQGGNTSPPTQQMTAGAQTTTTMKGG